MSRQTTDAFLAPQSPMRVFVLVLLVVFAAEGVIMLLLPWFPSSWHGTLADSLLDATLLASVTAPAVWLLVVRPLRQMLEARGWLLRRLLEAQEQEREHVGRDLHDGLGQDLTALLVGLRGIEGLDDLAAARARAAELREVAAAAHGEVRRLARGLRPVVLEELGLAAALARLAEDFERAHRVQVTLRSDALAGRRLEPGVETALYRIVQEGLANVARHAHASTVELVLREESGSIVLSIRDDGRGFDPADLEAARAGEGGFGLASIRERALALGGECAVRSRRGEGTTIVIRIPRP